MTVAIGGRDSNSRLTVGITRQIQASRSPVAQHWLGCAIVRLCATTSEGNACEAAAHLDGDDHVVLARGAIHAAGHQAGQVLLEEQVQVLPHHGLHSADAVLQCKQSQHDAAARRAAGHLAGQVLLKVQT